MFRLISDKILKFTCFCFFLLSTTAIFSEQPSLSVVGNLYPSTACKIGSQVPGRVEEVFVEVGDSVKKGQPLIQLDKKQFEIDFVQKEALVQSAKNELQDAEINYNRMKKLWEKPAGEAPTISQKKFEESKLRYEQAKTQLVQGEQELKRAKLRLSEATIRASFDGVVTDRLVDPGETIANIPSTYLIEIQSTNPLFLEFSIPQIYLKTVKVGTPITFEVEGAEKPKYYAKVDLIYPNVDETTRTVKYRAIVDNSSQELRPGSLAKVEINRL